VTRVLTRSLLKVVMETKMTFLDSNTMDFGASHHHGGREQML